MKISDEDLKNLEGFNEDDSRFHAMKAELLALRKVADAAEAIMATADHDPDDWGALSDLEDALKAAGR